MIEDRQGVVVGIGADGERVRLDQFQHDVFDYEVVEIAPAALKIEEASYGGQQARNLLIEVEGFPAVRIVMPLGGAQAIGAALAETTIVRATSLPSDLPPPAAT